MKTKTLSDLISEVESDIVQYRKQSQDISPHDLLNIVKIYYVSDKQNRSRPEATYADFVKSIESCTSLCDIRATYFYRSEHKNEKSETLFLTPANEDGVRVDIDK